MRQQQPVSYRVIVGDDEDDVDDDEEDIRLKPTTWTQCPTLG